MPAAKLARPVNTTLNYWFPKDENILVGGTASSFLCNYNVQPVTVHDMRFSDSDFTIDQNGFQRFDAPTRYKGIDAYTDPDSVEEYKLGETTEFLKSFTGASRVEVLSHVLRVHRPEDVVAASTKVKPLDVVPLLGAVQMVHTDQSFNAARKALDHAVDAETAKRLRQSRWGIINVWRPIGATVQRDPLTMCDARSVADEDLCEIALLAPSTKAEWTGIKHSETATTAVWSSAFNPAHRWWYASQMTEDELYLIKCFDSKTDGRARLALHTSFVDPEQDFDAPARQSIEVRCLVFWEDQEAD